MMNPLRLAAQPGPRVSIASVAVDLYGNALIDVTFLAAGDQPVASLQFDVGTAQALPAIAVLSGPATTDAGKTVYTAGRRVLIAGPNTNAVASGVIARLSIQVSASTAAGVYPITADHIVASDAGGGAISISGESGAVVVSGAGVPAPSITRVSNAASFVADGVSPGEIIAIEGSGLGPADGVAAQLSGAGSVSTTLAGSRVLFDGIPAPLIYASVRQVTAIVPYGVKGRDSTTLQLEYLSVRSAGVALAIHSSAPGIFSLNGSGSGQGAILNQDGSINGRSNPAARGSVVSIYATGEGQTSPPGVDGAIVSASGLKEPLLNVTATIGGVPAEVLYAGSSPNEVSGLLQVNVRVPDSVNPSDASPVTITIGASSQPGITLAVR